MGKISDLLQNIIPHHGVSLKQDNKNGNANQSNNRIAKTINENTEYNFFLKDNNQIEKIYESVINKDSSIELREAIIPIEALINEGKFPRAIQKYERLIVLPQFNQYTKDERFLIYNGLLNCHINNRANDETINHWIIKIQALGTDIKEIYRYYFLLAIREYNRQDLTKARIYINQSIKANPDYINAITTEILFKTTMKEITYDEAKSQFNELLKDKGLNIKDLSSIYTCFGDAAFNSKDFSTAKENYTKSNDLSKSLSKDVAIAVCEYFLSFKEIKEDDRVDMVDIDFSVLKKAEDKFQAIYNNRTEDTIQTIVRMSFPYFFNIFALSNKYNKILDIYKETKDYFDLTMTSTLQHVVEAEVINGILNQDILSLFSEYEKIKFEALYHEKSESYDKVIELLIPALEGKYRNDRILQLSLLNGLKEMGDFDRYMQYFQKFSCHQDEVMIMNYIQFLMKREQKEQVLSEIVKLKSIVRNGFVLYDLLLIYLEYNLSDEMNEFFCKVDSGEYKIIGLQMPFVFYHRMVHLLNQKKYEEYFRLYENSDLTILKENHKIILKINYYIFKGDYENLASSYYEYFQLTENHNELIKAVQIKLQINLYHDAEFYLEQVNPMQLDNPEYYYMFKAIVLKEKKMEDKAFEILTEALEVLEIDLESPFHQFYTAFNMNNGRTDEACRYMSEYYAKNPNPYWFKVIQHSENESGSELIAKLEEAIGGERDLTHINRLFTGGIIGASSYHLIVGTNVDEILFFTHYPFTRVHISRGNVLETKTKVELIDNKIIIDATTLTIFSASDALHLLDVFKEILIPYSTMQALVQRQTILFKENVNKAIEYIKTSPIIKMLAVDENMKIKGEATKIISEDILDCISLAEKLDVPYLTTEVAVVNIEFKLNWLIDINVLFLYLKEKHSTAREMVSRTIAKMREMNLEFISFDADDMYNAYSKQGLEGIRPFLKMGINADYKTFTPVYVNFLSKLKKEQNPEEFELCVDAVICFMDKYVGKTRYYMASIIREHPNVEETFTKLIIKPSVKDIMLKNTTYNIYSKTVQDYMDIIDSYEFSKILSISAAFIGFIIQFLSMFNDNESERKMYIDFIKQKIVINDSEDIDYILNFSNQLSRVKTASNT